MCITFSNELKTSEMELDLQAYSCCDCVCVNDAIKRMSIELCTSAVMLVRDIRDDDKELTDLGILGTALMECSWTS